MSWSVWSPRPVKALRKAAICDHCEKAITVGEPGIRWFGVFEGDAMGGAYHPDCAAWQTALRPVLTGDDGYPRLCDLTDGEYFKDAPFRRQVALCPPPAAVLARMCPSFQEEVAEILSEADQ